jgi:hypothetical protein
MTAGCPFYATRFNDKVMGATSANGAKRCVYRWWLGKRRRMTTTQRAHFDTHVDLELVDWTAFAAAKGQAAKRRCLLLGVPAPVCPPGCSLAIHHATDLTGADSASDSDSDTLSDELFLDLDPDFDSDSGWETVPCEAPAVPNFFSACYGPPPPPLEDLPSPNYPRPLSPPPFAMADGSSPDMGAEALMSFANGR